LVPGEIFDLNNVFPEPSCEPPKIDDGGGSAGVKERADDGGGPAGVVDGFGARVFFAGVLEDFAETLKGSRPESGVDGACGLDENGTVQPDMMIYTKWLAALDEPELDVQTSDSRSCRVQV